MISVLGFFIATLVAIASGSSTDKNGNSLFAKNNANFTSSLYSAIRKFTNANIVISPFSLQVAGALIYNGASGKTAKEIMNGFHLTENNSTKVKQNFEVILHKLETNPSVQIANKIYLANGIEFKPDFKRIASEEFLSEVENVDFSRSSEVAEQINNWIRNVTAEKISCAIDERALNADTRLLLVNAIHFYGEWKKPFEKLRTKKSPFWISASESKEMEMMRMVQEFKFKRMLNLNAYVLEMDYNNSDISMMIILPKARTGLAHLEKKLKHVDLLRLSRKLKSRDVIVRLPKFKIEFSTNLDDKFMKMGMSTLFTEEADFSHMLEGENIKIDQAIHKAFIEVNEAGTTAAAVTTIAYAPIMLRPRKRFQADHPFFFAIKTKSAILFVGKFKG